MVFLGTMACVSVIKLENIHDHETGCLLRWSLSCELCCSRTQLRERIRTKRVYHYCFFVFMEVLHGLCTDSHDVKGTLQQHPELSCVCFVEA